MWWKFCYSEHLLFNKVLLRSNDGPWSADPYPGDGLCSSQPVMFHHIAADQSASSPQTRWKEKDCVNILQETW